MNILISYRLHCIGLVALWTSLYNVDAWVYDQVDWSDDEGRLLKFSENSGSDLWWLWSLKPACRVLCPRRMGLEHFRTRIRTSEILLVGPGCAKMEVRVFDCSCETRRPTRYVRHAGTRDSYISSPSGEIYELRMASGRCDDTETQVIFDRIVGAERTPYLTLLPKLLGISRIFEAQNVHRMGHRSWNRGRVAGRILDSSEED